MAYQVLARKSRPQDFSSVVGQSSVVTALRNALSDGRVAQAYLFAGIRGVGKTSVARVFAKALNCENGPGSDPCNDCTTCSEITKGSDLDVIEVDAATYSKVEQVRELTESLQYGPARDRYKVVVIDEIHRLSRQAFDALLKIVEEPPDRVVFIFATTEIDAVPATILSRCQEFRFRRVAFGELAAHLRRLCESESIEASDTSLRLIARAAEGSVRDAVALLDQLATFGAGKIDDEAAARLIGALDASYYEGLLTAIVQGDSPTVCSAVAKLEEEGWDPRTAYTQLLNYLRDALHLALGADPGEVDLPAEPAQSLATLASETGSENLLRILHLLLASEMTVRRSESGGLAAEVAWLRAAELPKVVRIEEILSGTAPSSTEEGSGSKAPPKRSRARKAKSSTEPVKPQPVKQSPVKAPPASKPPAIQQPAGEDETETAETAGATEIAKERKPRKSDSASAQAKREPTDEQTTEAEGATAGNAAPSNGDGPVTTAAPPTPAASTTTGGGTERLIEELGRRKQFLAAHLAEAESLELSDNRLVIAVPADDTWLEDSLQRDSNRKALEEAIVQVWGEGVTWSLKSSGKPSAPTARSQGGATEDDIMSDPGVQAVLELFGGTVETGEANQEDDKS